MNKRHDVKFLKAKLDKAFSLWVRTSNANKEGLVRCITCNKEFPIKRIQCGHYIVRNHLHTRWLKENTAPQCFGCNGFGKGKPDIFALKLIEKYGKDILQKLNKIKNQPTTPLNSKDLEKQIAKYEKQLKQL